jgi:hypothetical protein
MKYYQTCRVCKAVNFNKRWHHGDHVKVANLKKSPFAWVTRCPACKMIESHKYGGKITITNVPSMASRELFYLIDNHAKQEYQKNCQHRLIEIVKRDQNTWILTTTDNQMASKLANRIRQAFDHVEVKTSYIDGENPIVKSIVEFLPLFYHRFNFERS